MKANIPEIKESISQLRTLIKKEKDGTYKDRLQLLYLLKSGKAKSIKAAADLLHIHRNTVRNWLNVYKKEGLKGLLHRKNKDNRKGKYSIKPEIIEALVAKLKSKHDFSGYEDIRIWLRKEFGVEIEYSSLYGLIRYQLKLKFKPKSPATPRKMKEKRTPDKRPSPGKKNRKKKKSRYRSIKRRRFIDLQNKKTEKYSKLRLHSDRRRAAFSQMRNRLKAVKQYRGLRKSGMKAKDAAEIVSKKFGCCPSTIRNWYRAYEKNGKRGLIPCYQIPNYEPKTPFEVILIIIMLRRLSHWGGNRISKELESRGIYKISHTGVYKLFKRYHLKTRTYHPTGKRNGIQYKRYEAENENELWHLDFIGPFETAQKQKYYVLLVIDDHSRFLIDLYVTNSLETKEVTQRLALLFYMRGKPQKIMTDNAKTFVSAWEEENHQFKKFLEDHGIEHVTIQPYYPESNGKAEAAVKIVKKEAIIPFIKENINWNPIQLQQLLMKFIKYYNFDRLHGGIGWETPAVKYKYFIGKEQKPKYLDKLFFVNELELKFNFC